MWLVLFFLAFASFGEAYEPVFPYFEGSAAATNRRAIYGGEVFLPAWQKEGRLLFFDGRAFFDTKQRFEGNLGFGYRQMLFCNRAIFGANIFGDIHRSRKGCSFGQVSFGLEWMSHYIEARANVYLPNDKRHTIKRVAFLEELIDVYPIKNFVDVEYFPKSTQRTRERALSGYDAEIGLRLPMPESFPNFDLFLYGGYYHYDAKNVKAIDGGRARLELQVYDPLRCFRYYGSRLTLEAGIRSDNIRDGEGYLALRLAIPLYDCLASPFPCGLARRMSHRVVRHEQVVVHKYEEKFERTSETRRLKNPNGTDVRIIYVNGDDGVEGRGTFEDPYNQLSDGLEALELDYDILYIFPTGSNQGISVGNYVVPGGIPHLQISGSGIPLVIDGFTVFGVGPTPNVTGQPGSSFVFDISGVEHLLMEGFNVLNPDVQTPFSGIQGYFEGLPVDLNFSQMEILGTIISASPNPLENGLNFTFNNNGKNIVRLMNNREAGSNNDQSVINNLSGSLDFYISDMTFEVNVDQSLRFYNYDKLNLFIDRSQFSNQPYNFIPGIGQGLYVENSNGGLANVHIAESEFESFDKGIVFVNNANSVMHAHLFDTKINNNTSIGLQLTGTGAASELHVETTRSEFNFNGIGVQEIAINSAKVTFESHEGEFIGNTVEDLFVYANQEGVAKLHFRGLNRATKLHLFADDEGSVVATRNGTDAVVEVEIIEQGTGTVTVDPNPFVNP